MPQALRVLVASPPGGGKTTLCTTLQERLANLLPSTAVHGFLSREIRGPGKVKVGYELYSVDGQLSQTLASITGPESGFTVAKYNVYLEAMEKVAIPAIDRALSTCGARFCVVDDIGSMTCKSDEFVARVRTLLEYPDPALHVLAAVGSGGGFTIESRKIEGVTNLNIDPDNRDGLLNSLLARFENAILKAGDAESENGIDDNECEDLTDFDEWGGDGRRLGVKRGMYKADSSPLRVRGRGRGRGRSLRACIDEDLPTIAAESNALKNEAVAETVPQIQTQSARGCGRGRTASDLGNSAVESSTIFQARSVRGRGRGRTANDLDASEVQSPPACIVSEGRARGRGRGCGQDAGENGRLLVLEAPSEKLDSALQVDAASVPTNGHRGRGRGRGRGFSQVAAAVRHGPSVVEWLEKMDDGKFNIMLSYGEAIKQRFDFVDEVIDKYQLVGDNSCGQFFEDFGITKVGHKRLFEKSFREVQVNGQL